jgi:hypothetical protein
MALLLTKLKAPLATGALAYIYGGTTVLIYIQIVGGGSAPRRACSITGQDTVNRLTPVSHFANEESAYSTIVLYIHRSNALQSGAGTH